MFFDIKTSLNIKWGKCGHVLATVRNSILKNPFFLENPQTIFFMAILNGNVSPSTGNIEIVFSGKFPIWFLGSVLEDFETFFKSL